MIRTQISFDKTLYERVKRSAKRQGVSMAELCRRCVSESVAKEDLSKPWMKFAGRIEGAAGDSSSVDEVLYGRAAP